MQRVFMVAFEGSQTLDVTGPTEVLAAANRYLSRATPRAHYETSVTSVGGGERTTSSGIVIKTRDLLELQLRSDDTVLVSGGEEAAVRAAAGDRTLRRWLLTARRTVRRIGSICTGTFVLAAAGILDGLRVATHWQSCDLLARMYPRVTVDRNAIYVHEGSVWTSAGVTTGIDMALAMVEEDLGRQVADAVAARLVLYVRRPGFQSQFSDALVAQSEASDPLGPVIAWARSSLRRADVEGMARAAGISVRTLHRRCLEHLDTTPAKLLDRLRVEHARTLLSTTSMSAKTLAVQCGFGSAVCLKRAFEREFGVGPREYRMLFAKTPPGVNAPKPSRSPSPVEVR